MKIVVIDGQGGGIGKLLVERLRKELPDNSIVAIGSNALATSAMIRSGADYAATGENAVCVNAQDADIIMGPIGIVLANAMLGEITPAMAMAVGASKAQRILVPISRCNTSVAGFVERPVAQLIDSAIAIAKQTILS